MQCGVHPAQQWTHFCEDSGCLVPICLACKAEQKHPHERIVSIDIVKQKLEKKVAEARKTFQNLLDEARSPNEQINVNQGKISKAKEDVLRTVHQFFNQLEAEYHQQLNQKTEEEAQFEHIEREIEGQIEEIERMNLTLYQDQPSEWKSILELNIPKKKESWEKRLRQLEERRRCSEIVQVEVIDFRIGELKKVLEQYIKISQPEIQIMHQTLLGSDQLGQVYIENFPRKNYFTQRDRNWLIYFTKNEFHFYDLAKGTWNNFQLRESQIPDKSSWIMTPKGYIYVIGGEKQLKDSIQSLSISDKKLITQGQLFSRHNYASLAANDKYIYIIGGTTNNEQGISLCERFDYERKQNMQLPNLPQAICYASLCTFQNSILVTAGLFSQELLKGIVYLLKNDNWLQISVRGIPLGYMSGVIELDNKRVLILGGYKDSEQTEACLEAAVLQLENECKHFSTSIYYPCQLQKPQSFYNNPLIIHDNCLYVLYRPSHTSSDPHRVLKFDKKWETVC